jgi:hypothetical protein
MPVKNFLSLKGYKYCQWLSFAMLSGFVLVKPAYAQQLNNTANSPQNQQDNKQSNILGSKGMRLKDAIQQKKSKGVNSVLPNLSVNLHLNSNSNSNSNLNSNLNLAPNLTSKQAVDANILWRYPEVISQAHSPIENLLKIPPNLHQSVSFRNQAYLFYHHQKTY